MLVHKLSHQWDSECVNCIPCGEARPPPPDKKSIQLYPMVLLFGTVDTLQLNWVNNKGELAIVSEFESQWVLHTSDIAKLNQ